MPGPSLRTSTRSLAARLPGPAHAVAHSWKSYKTHGQSKTAIRGRASVCATLASNKAAQAKLGCFTTASGQKRPAFIVLAHQLAGCQTTALATASRVLQHKMLRLLTTCALAAAKTSPYSFSLSTFSPEGRIQQIEFAGKAVDNGPPCAAITTRDGVILAKAYKRPSDKLAVEGHSLHILRVTETTIATYAGLPADFRALVDAARTIAIELERTNGFPPSASMLANEIGRRVQERTQRGGFRPYGCSLLLASPSSLYRIDPSGWVAPLRACAAGAGSASIQADLVSILEEDAATATRRLVELLSADGRGVAVALVSADSPIDIDVDASTGEGEEAVAPAG